MEFLLKMLRHTLEKSVILGKRSKKKLIIIHYMGKMAKEDLKHFV